jgi:hypothetical protein
MPPFPPPSPRRPRIPRGRLAALLLAAIALALSSCGPAHAPSATPRPHLPQRVEAKAGQACHRAAEQMSRLAAQRAPVARSPSPRDAAPTIVAAGQVLHRLARQLNTLADKPHIPRLAAYAAAVESQATAMQAFALALRDGRQQRLANLRDRIARATRLTDRRAEDAALPCGRAKASAPRG